MGHDWDLDAWVEEEKAAGTSTEDIITKLEEKKTKKEQMIAEIDAKIEELRGESA